jgi:hypothetical protein
MDVAKSSRHSKITGDFAEALVLYWLSKYAFECARVDHTGIDIIARNPNCSQLMGISVKCRSRSTGKEQTHLRIGNDNFGKAAAACASFGCDPYFAIVVDAADTITTYLLSMDHLLELHPMAQTSCSWSMRAVWIERYSSDPAIKRFTFNARTDSWW